mgnify:CR=1 FL=1
MIGAPERGAVGAVVWAKAGPAKARSSHGMSRAKEIAVEAGVRFGWDAVIGHDGTFVGMSSFGASGPYKEVYKHFGITPEAVAEAAMKRHNG